MPEEDEYREEVPDAKDAGCDNPRTALLVYDYVRDMVTDESEARAFDVHVAGCVSCQDKVTDWTAFLEMLGGHNGGQPKQLPESTDIKANAAAAGSGKSGKRAKVKAATADDSD